MDILGVSNHKVGTDAQCILLTVAAKGQALLLKVQVVIVVSHLFHPSPGRKGNILLTLRIQPVEVKIDTIWLHPLQRKVVVVVAVLPKVILQGVRILLRRVQVNKVRQDPLLLDNSQVDLILHLLLMVIRVNKTITIPNHRLNRYKIIAY